MKKKIVSVFALVFCVFSIFMLASCGAPKEKTFVSEKGISITLTDEFQEMSVSNIDFALTTNKVAFFANKETFQQLDTLGGQSNSSSMTVKEYAELVKKNNSLSGGVQEHDGMADFDYTKNVDGVRYIYTAFALKGSDCFWLCQFAMKESDYDDNFNQFLKWANTIEVE